MARKPYAIRDTAVALYRQGHSLREVAAKCAVGLGTAHRWISQDAPELMRRSGTGMSMAPVERFTKCARQNG